MHTPRRTRAMPWMLNPKRKPKPHGKDRRYNTRAWRKYRSAYLRRHPLCVACGDVAQMVDHIKPLRLNPELNFFSESNHQGMCHRCHNSKRGKESHTSMNYDREHQENM